MRLGKISLAPNVEQILDAVKIEEESVAATASEECVVARLDDVRLGAECDLCVGDYLLPDSFDGARLQPSNALLTDLPWDRELLAELQRGLTRVEPAQSPRIPHYEQSDQARGIPCLCHAPRCLQPS